MRAVVLLMIWAGVASAACGRFASTSKTWPPASLLMPSTPQPAVPVRRVMRVANGDTLRAIDQGSVEQRIRPHRCPPTTHRIQWVLADDGRWAGAALHVEKQDAECFN